MSTMYGKRLRLTLAWPALPACLPTSVDLELFDRLSEHAAKGASAERLAQDTSGHLVLIDVFAYSKRVLLSSTLVRELPAQPAADDIQL